MAWQQPNTSEPWNHLVVGEPDLPTVQIKLNQVKIFAVTIG